LSQTINTQQVGRAAILDGKQVGAVYGVSAVIGSPPQHFMSACGEVARHRIQRRVDVNRSIVIEINAIGIIDIAVSAVGKGFFDHKNGTLTAGAIVVAEIFVGTVCSPE
jgi:ribosomal protein S19E (S16A)